MGRTVPSVRQALYQERSKWKQFRLALDRKERKIFDEMFAISRLYISSSMMSCKPIRIHPILLSIIFHHFKQISHLGGMKI